jgi:hypothetical protein
MAKELFDLIFDRVTAGKVFVQTSKIFLSRFLLCAVVFVAFGGDALAEDFLLPVQQTTNSTPSFLSPVQQEASLQQSQNALLAPGSVNGQGIPYVPGLTSGFPTSQSIPVPSSSNSYGNYAGTELPIVSTGSVNLNTVDCPFIGTDTDTSGMIYIPGRIINGQVQPWVNLNQTAANAAAFLQQSIQDITSQ